MEVVGEVWPVPSIPEQSQLQIQQHGAVLSTEALPFVATLHVCPRFADGAEKKQGL